MKNASILTRALVFGAMLTVAIAILGSVGGYLVAGFPGLASALIGTVLAALFLGFTSLSILIAQRATKNKPSPAMYFGIILGVWVLKFVIFIVALVLLRGQPWLSPLVFLLALIAAVMGSLIVDGIALKGARVPYVGDIELPGPPSSTPAPESRDL